MGMNRSFSESSTDSLAARTLLRQKFHPSRYPQMSGLMAAIIGFVVDAPFGNPRISDIIVTPDGFVFARVQGKTSSVPVGHYDDLIRGCSLLEGARLTRAERMEAEL